MLSAPLSREKLKRRQILLHVDWTKQEALVVERYQGLVCAEFRIVSLEEVLDEFGE